MKYKHYVVFLSLIAAVILISSCSAVSVNSNTAWHTYENQKYGYSFDYPPDCTSGPLPADCKSAPPEEQRDECLCFLNPEDPDRTLMQRFQNDGAQLVLAEFSVAQLSILTDDPLDGSGLLELLSEYFPDQWDDANVETINIDGVSAVSMSSPASETAPVIKKIYFSHNGYLFQISMLNPNLEINSSLYQRILTSFRINQSVQLDEEPLPPEEIEGMIADFLREEHPDLASDFKPILQEISMQGEVLKQVSARIFRVTEGVFENETFLITHNGIVLPMGTAIGGKGVSSMALSDLDQDGQTELYFTYSFGSGIHQTHLGVYAPAYDPQKIYAAETYFFGDLMLFSEHKNQISVRVVEGEPETMTIEYRETLGQLKLEKIGLGPVLKIELLEDLPEEIMEFLIQPEEHQDAVNGL